MKKLSFALGVLFSVALAGCAGEIEEFDAEQEIVADASQAIVGDYAKFDSTVVASVNSTSKDVAAADYALYLLRTNGRMYKYTFAGVYDNQNHGTGFTAIDFVDSSFGVIAASDSTGKIYLNAQNAPSSSVAGLQSFNYPSGVTSVLDVAGVPLSAGQSFSVYALVPSSGSTVYLRKGTYSWSSGVTWDATNYCGSSFRKQLTSRTNDLLAFYSSSTRDVFQKYSSIGSSCTTPYETMYPTYREHAYTYSNVQDRVEALGVDWGNGATAGNKFYAVDKQYDAAGTSVLRTVLVTIPAVTF